MTTKIKIAAVALALTTLAGGMAATTNEAQARNGRNTAFAIGIASGVALGALASGHSRIYVGHRRHKRCRWVDQFDAWGNYMGTARVCRRFW